MKFSRTGRGYSVDGQQIFERTRKHGAIGLLVSVLATECQLRLTKCGTEVCKLPDTELELNNKVAVELVTDKDMFAAPVELEGFAYAPPVPSFQPYVRKRTDSPCRIAVLSANRWRHRCGFVSSAGWSASIARLEFSKHFFRERV